jgi:micrococcal nuclease
MDGASTADNVDAGQGVLVTRRRALLALLLWSIMLGGAWADERLHVAEIDQGDAFILEDGRRVRLVGIDAPRAPLGVPKDVPWRLAESAKTALADLAQNRIVTLRLGEVASDRYGRVLAQVYREDGMWLQGELLRRGLARVHSYADNRALVPEMLALEGEARSARRGLWRDPNYAVRRPEEAGRFIESFQLVEGTIVDVAKVKGQVFLNFAPDWRTAFTAHLPRDALPRFKESGIDPNSLKGARVRLRGWVRFYERPMIDVTHPEQIELLDRP